MKYTDILIERSKANVTAKPQERQRSAQERELKMLLPSSVDVFGSEVILRWKDKQPIDQNYEVVFKNMLNEVIMIREAEGSQIKLNFEDGQIAREPSACYAEEKEKAYSRVNTESSK